MTGEEVLARCELIEDARLRAAVTAGVKLLNERVLGWPERVDLERLEMTSCKRCVLGQVFAHLPLAAISDGYEAGLDVLFGDWQDEPVVYGFAVAGPFPQWRDLQEAWELVLAPLAEVSP